MSGAIFVEYRPRRSRHRLGLHSLEGGRSKFVKVVQILKKIVINILTYPGLSFWQEWQPGQDLRVPPSGVT